METGKGTGDGPGDEELINTPGGPSSSMKNLGKGTQEDIKPLSTSGLAPKSRLDPKNTNRPTYCSAQISLNTNFTQHHALSKDKGLEEDMLVSNSGHGNMAQNKETSTNRRDGPDIAPCSSEEHITLEESSSSKESLTPAIQGIAIHTVESDLAQPDLEVVAIVAPAPAAPAQSNVAMLVTFPVIAPAEPNVGPIVAAYSVAPAQINAALVVDPSSAPLFEPNVAENIAALGLAFAQPSVALLVATAPVVAPTQSLPAPNVSRSTRINVAPPSVAPAQLNGAAVAAPHVAPLAAAPAGQNRAVNVARPVVAHAERNGASAAAPRVAPVGQNPDVNVARLVVAAQQNVAPVDAAPAPAPAQQNAAAVVAPPGVPPALPNVIDINDGLTRSRLRLLRTFESGQEGNLWPKL